MSVVNTGSCLSLFADFFPVYFSSNYFSFTQGKVNLYNLHEEVWHLVSALYNIPAWCTRGSSSCPPLTENHKHFKRNRHKTLTKIILACCKFKNSKSPLIQIVAGLRPFRLVVLGNYRMAPQIITNVNTIGSWFWHYLVWYFTILAVGTQRNDFPGAVLFVLVHIKTKHLQLLVFSFDILGSQS